MTDANEIPPPARGSLVPDLEPRPTQQSRPLTEPPGTDRPPTAKAIASAFLDLEEKLLERLGENHREQMGILRDGQNKAIRFYEEAKTQLTQALSRFDDEFGRAVMDLQLAVHHGARQIHDHTLQLEGMNRRMLSLEKWRAEIVPLLRTLGHGDDPVSG